MKRTIFTLIIEDNSESTGLFVDAMIFATKKDALIALQKQEEIFSQANNDHGIEINDLEKVTEHFLYNDSNYIDLTIKETEIEL